MHSVDAVMTPAFMELNKGLYDCIVPIICLIGMFDFFPINFSKQGFSSKNVHHSSLWQELTFDTI